LVEDEVEFRLGMRRDAARRDKARTITTGPLWCAVASLRGLVGS